MRSSPSPVTSARPAATIPPAMACCTKTRGPARRHYGWDEQHVMLGERPPKRANLHFGWWYAGIGQRVPAPPTSSSARTEFANRFWSARRVVRAPIGMVQANSTIPVPCSTTGHRIPAEPTSPARMGRFISSPIPPTHFCPHSPAARVRRLSRFLIERPTHTAWLPRGT